jgi:hypothetical protein
MLITAINWLYVIFTTYFAGYGFHHLMTGISFLQHSVPQRRNAALRTAPYEVQFRENYLITGIVLVSIYSQFVSIWHGVGCAANIILFVMSLVVCVYAIRDMFYKILSYGLGRNISMNQIIIYIVIFLIVAYCTSHGIEHYDTGLYHAQAIHWNEVYGAVKGLGNFNQRLAYNSAVYPLSALYSFAWAGGVSMHTMAGYFVLLLSWKCVDIIQVKRRGYFTLPDAVRLIAIYYIFTILDEIVSPASDYFVMCMVLYILISWLDLDRDREKRFYPYAMLCILVVYAVTLKLSAAPLLLLAIKPIWKIMHAKLISRPKAIWYFIGLGLFVAIPFFIRNMIISGWLVYPVTAIDLFKFAWKIPKGTAQYDAHEIAVYGRGYTDAGLYNISIWDWFPGWFKALSAFNKAMLIADAVFLAGLLVFAAIYLVMQIRSGGITFEFPFRKSNGKRSRRKGQKPGNKSGIKPFKKGKKSLFDNAGKVVLMARHRTVSFKDFIFIDTIAYVALAFFILSSPLVRYGALYIWLPAVLMTGKLVTLLFYQRGAEKRLMPVVIAFIAVFIGYKSLRLVMYEIPRFRLSYLFMQQEYMTYELESYEIDGYTFYYPVTGDQTGYAPFPSAPTRADVKLMGDDIKDGFLRNK